MFIQNEYSKEEKITLTWSFRETRIQGYSQLKPYLEEHIILKVVGILQISHVIVKFLKKQQI